MGRLLLVGHLCAGIGTGYPDRGGVPGGLLNVPGVVFADRLRNRVLEGQEVKAWGSSSGGRPVGCGDCCADCSAWRH